MKKIFLGFISSLLATLGLSSFSSSKIFIISYYWFYVESSLPISDTHPTFEQISGDYLGYSTQININNAPSCTGTGALCLVGYTLNSISGFSAIGVPTGLQTVFSGEPKSYATRGGTTQFF